MDFNSEQWRSWTRLMGRIQADDKEAYALLLSEISPLIFNYVRKRVFNREHVEDVFQEVLLTFHKARHTYQTDRPFSPWLFTIVRNSVWTAIHKNRKFAEKEILLENLPEVPWFDGQDQGLDDRLHQAMEKLSMDNRQAVEMLKLRGMDVENASRELGISKIALKVRAHRGYVHLRKILLGKKEAP